MISMIDELISSSIPDTPTIFEKNMDSFKKNPEKLFEYLKKF